MLFSLHENIQKLRTNAGLNQVEFAKQIGVTKQCVSNWENDNVLPSAEMLVRISDFFKVPLEVLLGREDRKIIDATELTDEQYAHVRLIVKDLAESNASKRKQKSTK